MNIKKIIIYFSILALVVVEGYLVYNMVSGDINNKRETAQYCGARCNYNQNVLLWEFSGDNITKGFTTEEECLNHCSRVKNGFAYYLSKYSSAFLSFFNFNR